MKAIKNLKIVLVMLGVLGSSLINCKSPKSNNNYLAYLWFFLQPGVQTGKLYLGHGGFDGEYLYRCETTDLSKCGDNLFGPTSALSTSFYIAQGPTVISDATNNRIIFVHTNGGNGFFIRLCSSITKETNGSGCRTQFLDTSYKVTRLRAVLDKKNNRLLVGFVRLGTTGVSLAVCDSEAVSCKFRQVTTWTSSNVPNTPDIFYDDVNQQAMILALDPAASNALSIFRCNYNSTACTSRVLDATLIVNDNARFGVDSINSKLIAVTGQYLLRCNLDGSNCNKRTLPSNPGVGSYYDGIPIVVTASSKLLVIGVANTTVWSVQCNLDGASCNPRILSNEDRVLGKIGSVQLSTVEGKIFFSSSVFYPENNIYTKGLLYSCDLNGDICQSSSLPLNSSRDGIVGMTL